MKLAIAATFAMIAVLLTSGHAQDPGQAELSGFRLIELDDAATGTATPFDIPSHAVVAARLEFPPLATAVTGAGLSQPKVFRPDEVSGRFGFRSLNPGLLHEPSGMNCPPGFGLANEAGEVLAAVGLVQIVVYDGIGRDVSCAYGAQNGNTLITVFASDWADRTLEWHFDVAVGFMVQETTPETMFRPTIVNPGSRPGLQDSIQAAGLDGLRGGQLSVREGLWLAKTTSGWHVKLRITTAPPSQPPMILAAIIFESRLTEVINGASFSPGTLINDRRQERSQQGPVEVGLERQH